jgi:hypothetical protein
MGWYQGIALAMPQLLEVRRPFRGWASKLEFHHRLKGEIEPKLFEI